MKNKPIILFDGVCNLCNKSVQFVLKYEKASDFQFASLQSDFGQQKLKALNLKTQHFDSVVLIENDILYKKSRAVLKICKYLKFPFSLLSVFLILPSFFGDIFYDIVAKKRYKWFGKEETCWLPESKFKNRFLD